MVNEGISILLKIISIQKLTVITEHRGIIIFLTSTEQANALGVTVHSTAKDSEEIIISSLFCRLINVALSKMPLPNEDCAVVAILLEIGATGSQVIG